MNPTESIWPVEDDESALIREVYARYGLAMYMAQVLEHGIVNALLVLRFLPTRAHHKSKEVWEFAFDDFYSGELGKTLGNMVRTLSALEVVPEQIIGQLRTAKVTRDVLAHRFFRDNDLKFMTQSGRVEMIEFCEKAAEEFRSVDRELEAYCKPYRVRFGMTDQWIDEKCSEMLAQARSDANQLD